MPKYLGKQMSVERREKVLKSLMTIVSICTTHSKVRGIYLFQGHKTKISNLNKFFLGFFRFSDFLKIFALIFWSKAKDGERKSESWPATHCKCLARLGQKRKKKKKKSW